MKEKIFLCRNLFEKLFTDKRNNDTCYRMDIVLKKIIKRLIVVILLKNFKERRIHYLIKKDRQFTYNVTLMHLRVTIVQGKNVYFILWEYVTSFMYPACNAHVPCCHMSPVRPCNIFLHYLINGAILEKLLNIN